MAKTKGQPPRNTKVRDGTVKEMFGELAPEIVHCLTNGAISFPEDWSLDDVLNVELNRNALAIDFGSRILIFGEDELIILNVETQADPDDELFARMCEYAINLYRRYGRKVYSIALFPFKCPLPEYPFRIEIDEHEFLVFRPIVICLWERDSQEALEKEQWALFAFLPAMNHPSLAQMKQAVHKLEERLATDNYELFMRCLSWFLTILERTPMVSKHDKQSMKEYLEMRYQLHPWLAENSTIKGVIETEVAARWEQERVHLAEAQQQAVIAQQAAQQQAFIAQQQAAAAQQQATTMQKLWKETERKLIDGLREADRKAMQEIALAKQQAAEEAARAKQQAAEEAALAKQQAAEEAAHAEEAEIRSLKELISDFVAARCSTSVASTVQQTIKLAQDTERLKAFFRQLIRISDEQEVAALLVECFPAPSEVQTRTAGIAEGLKEAILDLLDSRQIAAPIILAVQQAIAPVQSVEQLRAFFRQIALAADEQAVSELLAQAFPTSS